jgi:hypothetical protein
MRLPRSNTMTWVRCALLLLPMLVFSTDVLSAQSIPDFNGHWVRVGAGSPQRLSIVQDASTMTVEEGNPSAGRFRHTVRLDGSEITTIPGAPTRPLTDVVTRASVHRMSALELVVVSKTQGKSGSWEETRIYSLDSNGNLVVRRTITSLRDRTTSSQTQIYRKA